MASVTLKVENKIGIITIDAPPVNALNKQVLDELEQRIEEVDSNIHVVIVTGAGSKVQVSW